MQWTPNNAHIEALRTPNRPVLNAVECNQRNQCTPFVYTNEQSICFTLQWNPMQCKIYVTKIRRRKHVYTDAHATTDVIAGYHQAYVHLEVLQWNGARPLHKGPVGEGDFTITQHSFGGDLGSPQPQPTNQPTHPSETFRSGTE